MNESYLLYSNHQRQHHKLVPSYMNRCAITFILSGGTTQRSRTHRNGHPPPLLPHQWRLPLPTPLCQTIVPCRPRIGSISHPIVSRRKRPRGSHLRQRQKHYYQREKDTRQSQQCGSSKDGSRVVGLRECEAVVAEGKSSRYEEGVDGLGEGL